MEYISSSSKQPTKLNHSSISDFGILNESIFRFKSSRYRGVQKIKGKETYAAHVYDNGHLPKARRTIYLGRFDKEENAARAHDLVSLKFWGASAQTNFPISDYEKVVENMKNLTDQDVVVAIRRTSSSFPRGKSKYRGVARHANSGKWQARKGPGKDSFLGTFESEKEAAIAFDIASIKVKGYKAITNFDINTYNVKAILQCETDQKDKEAKKMVNLTKKITASNVMEKPESSGLGNRRKKRARSFCSFFGRKTETGFSGDTSAISETPLTASAGLGSQHGALIPIFSENESMQFPTEPHTSLALGFQHSNTGVIQSYKQAEPHKPSILHEVNTVSPDLECWSSNLYSPYLSELLKAHELKGIVSGFQHASSSCFKPFKKE